MCCGPEMPVLIPADDTVVLNAEVHPGAIVFTDSQTDESTWIVFCMAGFWSDPGSSVTVKTFPLDFPG